MGATPEIIRKRYLRNAEYQRPAAPVEPEVVQKLYDPTFFVENLNKYKLYPSYRSFFEKELSTNGYEKVFSEHLSNVMSGQVSCMAGCLQLQQPLLFDVVIGGN